MKTKEKKPRVNWSIDKVHSEISFKVRHLMIAFVKGEFKSFDANVITERDDFSDSKIELSIDVQSISTGDEYRDEHLRSPDFFNTEKYNTIRFQSNFVSPMDSDENMVIKGDLTIIGITKPITLNARFGGKIKDQYGDEKAGFHLIGKINRSDWGLTWNKLIDAGGVLICDEVTLICEVELIKDNKKEAVRKIRHESIPEKIVAQNSL